MNPRSVGDAEHTAVTFHHIRGWSSTREKLPACPHGLPMAAGRWDGTAAPAQPDSIRSHLSICGHTRPSGARLCRDATLGISTRLPALPEAFPGHCLSVFPAGMGRKMEFIISLAFVLHVESLGLFLVAWCSERQEVQQGVCKRPRLGGRGSPARGDRTSRTTQPQVPATICQGLSSWF